MTLDEYQLACERTAPTKENARDRLSHLALALGAEASGEVLSIALAPMGRDRWFLSELGDCLWYATTLATSMELRLSELRGARAPAASSEVLWASRLAVTAGQLQELVRCHLFAGAILDVTAAATILRQVIDAIEALATGRGMDLEAVIEMNLTKLQKRFPR